MVEMNIFEDIFNNGTTGNLIIEDSINLQETLPIIGSNTLKVKFRTIGGKLFNKEFIVHKLENTEQKGKTKHYLLKFISPILLQYNKRLSRYYEGYTSDIVHDVLTKHLDIDASNITIEKTKSFKEFVVPNWLPLKFVNYLTANSVSETNNSASYLFYENRDGFNFVSIDKLCSEPISRSINVNLSEPDREEYTLDNVMSYEVVESYDILDNTRKGMYGSTLYWHDILKKSFGFNSITYDKNDVSTRLHPAGNRLLPDIGFSPENKIYLSSINYHNFDVSTRLKQRYSRLQEMENYCILCVVPGNTNQLVGDKIDFQIPSTKVSDVVKQDSFLSGSYLIARIRHTMTISKHVMTMELRKDSFRKRL
jgi:hypothetical protein